VTPEERKQVVTEFLTGVINEKRFDDLPRILHPELRWHGGGIGSADNLEEFTQLLAPFFSAFPDLVGEMHHLLCDGDLVTAHYTWTATHQGDLLGIPASGTRVSVSGISIFRVDDGRIVEEWWHEDLLGLLQQLGAIPAPQPMLR
jgi:steroid delta-isomerase-like uncharacterized protein